MSTRFIFGKAVRQIPTAEVLPTTKNCIIREVFDPLDNSLKQIGSGHHIYWRGCTMVANDYKFEGLTSCSHPDFEEFYRIYADSITARERKSRTWICEMV